jgi:hypothetical protein
MSYLPNNDGLAVVLVPLHPVTFKQLYNRPFELPPHKHYHKLDIESLITVRDGDPTQVRSSNSAVIDRPDRKCKTEKWRLLFFVLHFSV